MSLFGLDKTATLERSPTTQDAGGGVLSDTWATVAAGDSVRCALWPVGSSTAQLLLRRDIVSDVVIVFDTDIGARADDRINLDGTYYRVDGYGPAWSNAAITTAALYPAYCSLLNVLSHSAASAVTFFASTAPGTVFTSTVPADLVGRVTDVNFATAGTVNRAVTPEDTTAYYTPNVTAFRNLADLAVAGSGYIAWEAEAGTSVAPGVRYALAGDQFSTAGSWLSDQAGAQTRIAYHGTVLDLWRARQSTLRIGMEFGLPAQPAVSLATVQTTYATQYAALLQYEQTALASKVDYLMPIGYVSAGQSESDWHAVMAYYRSIILARYPTKPVQLLVSHLDDAQQPAYIGDTYLRYVFDTAAEFGWAVQLFNVTGALSASAWNVVRSYLS